MDKLKYIIITSISTKNYYLKNDEDFGEVPIDLRDTLKAGMIFNSYKEALHYSENKEFFIEGKRIKHFEEPFSLDEYRLDIMSVRITKPLKIYFEESEVRSVIENGDDSNLNNLVVTKNGEVVLFKGGTEESILEYACSNGEVFLPNNDYVGISASRDTKFIEYEYIRLLKAWEEHITSFGNFCTGDSYYDTIDINKSKKNISKFLKEHY